MSELSDHVREEDNPYNTNVFMIMSIQVRFFCGELCCLLVNYFCDIGSILTDLYYCRFLTILCTCA